MPDSGKPRDLKKVHAGPRRARRLHRRLAAYSAAAAATAAGSAGAQDATAALITFSINQTTPVNGALLMQVGRGSVVATTSIFNTNTTTNTATLGVNLVLAHIQTVTTTTTLGPQITFQGAFATAYPNLAIQSTAGPYGTTYYYVRRLAAGQAVGGGATQFYSFGLIASRFRQGATTGSPGYSYNYGLWQPGQRGFIGLEVYSAATFGTGTFFGFADVTLNPDFTITVHGVGIETTGGPAVTQLVPEPGALSMLALGAAGVMGLRRRRQAADRNEAAQATDDD